MLWIVAAVILLSIAAFFYWSATGEPVQAPAAPQSEATIPGT